MVLRCSQQRPILVAATFCRRLHARGVRTGDARRGRLDVFGRCVAFLSNRAHCRTHNTRSPTLPTGRNYSHHTHTAHKNRVPIQQHQLVLACAARQSRVVTRVALARRTECTCVRRAGVIHIIRSPGPALSHTAPQQPPTTHDDVKTLTSSRASWSSPSGGSSPPGARGRSSCTPGRSSTCTGPTTRGPRPPSPRPPSRRSTSSRP